VTAPDRYAVVGHPVAHSRSPAIHALFARQTGQVLVYEALDVAPEQFVEAVRAFFADGGRGLNVTVPHKEAAFALSDQLTERAQRARSVNTLARLADGTLLGHNTDGTGLVRDLTINLQVPISGRRLLLLGAGGAARGVLGPLLELSPRELIVANRTAGRAEQLGREFASLGRVRGTGFSGLPIGAFDLIINATAASLTAELPPLPADTIGAATICYDMGYAEGETRFVGWARERGAARAYSGLGMLVEQAAESFLLWRGVRPDTAPALAALGAADRAYPGR
jgi:shikimate dehydrogenase